MKDLLILVSMFYSLSLFAQETVKDPYAGFPLEVSDEFKSAKIGWVNGEDTLYYYYLKEPAVIQTYPLEGRVGIRGSGKVFYFYLSQDHTINGIDLYAKTGVVMSEEGRIEMLILSKPTQINGILVSTKELRISGESAFFHDNGSLFKFKPELDTRIDGYPCKARRRVYLDSLGHIISFSLSKDTIIDGKEYETGAKIYLDKDRNVSVLSDNVYWIEFRREGSVSDCFTRRPLTINGYDLTSRSRILFYDNGNILRLKTRKDILVQGILCKKKGSIYFYENGKLKSCIIADDLRVNGEMIPKETRIYLDKSGSISGTKPN